MAGEVAVLNQVNWDLPKLHFRSTKGASKQRRDLINSEITNLRDMLPLPETARQRLSQLQIMSLACCYIRKCNYFTRLFGAPAFTQEGFLEFSQALSGFLLITTRDGKLLYISENITDFLGHSMVDMMTQGDSLYDIIDKRDHSTVQSQLLAPTYDPNVAEERTFFCRMNVSRTFRRQTGFGDHKVMHVRGHFVEPLVRDHFGSQPLFMALCSPLITPDVKDTMIQQNTDIFKSVHSLDMKYMEITQNGEFFLGYDKGDMHGKSWYELLHPEDLVEAKEKHIQLIKSSHEMGCMLTVRLMAKDGSWVWVNMVMHIRPTVTCESGEPAIICINHVISATEAQHFKLQSQLYSSHIARSPEPLSSPSNTSPPHSITSVSMEQEQLRMGSFTSMLQSDEPLTYYGEIGVTVTTAGLVGRGDSSSSTSDNLSSFRTQTQEYTGDSLQLGPRNHKETLRAKIMENLKRKMAESQQGQQAHCKPAKAPRLGPRSDGDGGLVISGAFKLQPLMGSSETTMDSSAGSLAGGVDFMYPAVHVQNFPNINCKPEPQNIVAFEQLLDEPLLISQHLTTIKPPTPLTPDSLIDGETSSRLTIDVVAEPCINIPASLLTPDSTPTHSPVMLSPEQSLAEQEVPSFIEDLPEECFFPEPPIQETLKNVKMEVVNKPAKKNSKLPELDLCTLESYLSGLEGSEMQQLGVTQAVVEMMVASPASSTHSHSSMEGSPCPASPQEVARTPSPPSAVALPQPQPLARGTTSYEDLLSQLMQGQTDSVTSSVTEAIIDMVESVQARSPAAASPQITGDFMLVPEMASPMGAMETTVEQQMAAVAAIQQAVSELHQLNQISASSYDGAFFENL